MKRRRTVHTHVSSSDDEEQVKSPILIFSSSDESEEDEKISEQQQQRKKNKQSHERSFHGLPPSNTFGMNKTHFMEMMKEDYCNRMSGNSSSDSSSGGGGYSPCDEKNTFWFHDLFQPPTINPPQQLSTYLKRVYLSTYNVDVEWLFSNRAAHRRLCYADSIILVHGMQSLQLNLSDLLRTNPNLPFSQLIQKDKKLRLHFPELKLPYGTQHGKLYLIYFENSIRVVITTANLTSGDWNERLQGTWVQEFPKKSSLGSSTDSATSSSRAHVRQTTSTRCDFEETLVDYLNRLQMPDEAKRVREFDYSSAKVHLITSCPGYYSRDQLDKYGHMKVRKLLSRLEHTPQLSKTHCLFSSMGTLNEAYINQELYTSLSIPRVQDKKKTLQSQSKSGNLALIWPSVKTVVDSLAGPEGASHYCGDRKKFTKPFIMSALNHWEPVRYGHLSHTKLYTQLLQKSGGSHASTDNTKSSPELAWLFLTSSNLSKAAHGQLIHNGSSLMVRSFEIGVLFIPSDNQVFVAALDAPALKQTSKQASSSSENQQSETETEASLSSTTERIEFPLPYRLPLKPYHSSQDQPWCSEEYNSRVS